MVDSLPEADRKLVTGHESLGYFADRYGFKLDRGYHPQPELPGGSICSRHGSLENR